MEKNIINKKALGRKIKEARNMAGFTQAELAEKIGVSQNFLGDIERGIKSLGLPKLILLCNTLKISLDYLFSESLDNVLNEDGDVYYTDKQMAIIKNMVKTITNNF